MRTARSSLRLILTLLITLVAWTTPALAEETRPLLVGTRIVPPLAIQNPDGSWTGMSIELWKRVADEIKVPYRIEPFDFADLADPSGKGIDVVVSLPVTARYDAKMDLSYAFHTTGLAIATRSESRGAVSVLLSKVGTAGFLRTLAGLIAILFVMGVLVWAVERRAKPDEFGGHAVRGIAQGVFWSFESLVGKAGALSRTRTGRVLTLAWTFTCMLLVSGVTAKLASELTVSQLSSSISGPNDLPRVRVATIKASTAEHYLVGRGIPSTDYDDVEVAMAALSDGQFDALVYEAPILQYFAASKFRDRVAVLPGTFQNHGYGLGLRRPSDPLRDRINTAILKIVESDDWKGVLGRYLGVGSS
jgi:polar amino acid transport system substrate-binding protein